MQPLPQAQLLQPRVRRKTLKPLLRPHRLPQKMLKLLLKLLTQVLLLLLMKQNHLPIPQTVLPIQLKKQRMMLKRLPMLQLKL
jgi:hypothetical protein